MDGETIPMFPLGTVVFPFTAIPLHVFEPRYLTLLERLLSNEAGSFGIVLIERGFEVGGGDSRFGEGTRARLAGTSPAGEGRRRIVASAVERIRVLEWLPDDPHPWARVEAWEDEPEEAAHLVDPAHQALRRVMALASELGAPTAGLDLEVAPDPLVASYQISALAPIEALDAQRLLTAAGPATRLHLAIELLEARADLIRARLGDG